MFNLKNAAINTVIASSLLFGVVSPAFADATFVDSSEIGTWSSEAINSLVAQGLLVGYPDGTFGPKQNITREEAAVIIFKLVGQIEAYGQQIARYSDEGDKQLSNQLKSLQVQLLQIAANIDEEQTVEAIKRNNFVGIGLAYTINDGAGTNTDVELYGKYQIIELSDSLAISVRGTVDTNTLLTAGLSLDYDITKSIELFAGISAAYLLDQNNTSSLVGSNDDVVPVATVGGQVGISESTALYVKGAIPLTVDEGEDASVSGGLVWKF